MKTLASLVLLIAFCLTGCNDAGNTVIEPGDSAAADEGLEEANAELEASIGNRMKR